MQGWTHRMRERKTFGVNYILTFAAVIELSRIKMIMDLLRRWNVPARHGCSECICQRRKKAFRR